MRRGGRSVGEGWPNCWMIKVLGMGGYMGRRDTGGGRAEDDFKALQVKTALM